MLARLSPRSLFASSLFVSALLVFAGALASPVLAQDGGIAVGTKAPAAAVETLDGKTVDLAQYLGKKPVVLEFWATWCPLCRKLEPQLRTLQETYGDRVQFVSVGVPQNQTPERQQAHVAKSGMGGLFVFDRQSTAIAAYKVPHTSYVVMVDAAGTVVYTGVGGDQDLSTALRKALPTK